MAKITKQKALVAYFEDGKFSTRDRNARSNKYVVFCSKTEDKNYYIGKAGAVRHGKTIKDSIPMAVQVVSAMVKQGTYILEGNLLK